MAEATARSLVVEGRFNGPASSGNGGYACGLFAGLVDGPAEVSLRRPVPLDTRLTATHEDDGRYAIRDDEALIAEVRSAAPLELDAPARVSPDEARAARERYEGAPDGLFSSCFVCGRARSDSLEVFAGPVEGSELVASPWTPPAWTAEPDGAVRQELVWAVLDCPTYFALYRGVQPLSFLVSMSARIDAPVRPESEHVVISWPIERDGRKHRAGSAVLAADGEQLAVASALLVDTNG